MRPGREIDARVAQEIFGYEVFANNDVLHESTDLGVRPLSNYCKDMGSAWKITEKMKISLIPVENGNWFAFVGPQDGWTAPEAFLEFLRNGNFDLCGAAVGPSAPQVICEAALIANQKRKLSRAPDPSEKKTSLLDADAPDGNSTPLH